MHHHLASSLISRSKKERNKETNKKQTNKQTHKQTNKQLEQVTKKKTSADSDGTLKTSQTRWE